MAAALFTPDENWATGVMIGLLDLPPEILANVMEFADWDDVLRLRQVGYFG